MGACKTLLFPRSSPTEFEFNSERLPWRALFHRRALAAALAVALGLSMTVNLARAHLGPAAVKSVLALESGEPSILQLNEGLALRRGDTWHYVCPALWGDADMREADSVQGGPVIVGGDSGLWIFRADGTAEAHPGASTAGGVPLALGASRNNLMPLRLDGDLTQLLRIDPEQADIVWSDLSRWDTMGVGADFVVLVSMNTGLIQTRRIWTDGSELAEESAMGPASSLGATARVVDSTVYMVLKRLLDDGRWGVEAGLIEDGSWRSLHTGVAFVGPSIGPGGELIAGVDGQLSSFDDHVPQALPLETIVNCVDEFDGFFYACDSVGLRELTAQGPGPALFELEQLQPPPQDLVPDDSRELCDMQWDLYQQDLVWVGSTLPGTGDGEMDGGAVGPDSGTAMPGDLPATPGGMLDGGPAAPDGSPPVAGRAVTDGGPVAEPSSEKDSGGCGACQLGKPAGGRHWQLPLLVMTACLVRIGRRQRRSTVVGSPRPSSLAE